MGEDLNKTIKILQGQGHAVRPYIRYGTLWFEIDGNMLATRQEMLELGDSVYSLRELAELFARRNAQGEGRP